MMKKFLGLILTAALFTSCADNEAEETTVAETQDSVAVEMNVKVVDTLCFLRVGGANNVDSAFIKLIMENDSMIYGQMRYLPREKDSRIGVLLPGRKHGDTLSLDWNCIQEGRKFTVPVSFILRDGAIYQKLWAYDKQGEEYLPDTAAYGLMYQPIPCSLFPVKVY